MVSVSNPPRLTAADAAVIAADVFGVVGSASALPSERDQNFQIRCADGSRSVLKIANAAERREMLEAENAVMQRLAASQLVPRLLTARSGESIARSGDHFVRMITWIDGQPLAAVEGRSDALFLDIGRAVGAIDRALAGFDHPALHREFHWDLAGAPRLIRDRLHLVTDGALRDAAQRVLALHEEFVAPRLSALRTGVIHADANDYNVLVDAQSQRVAGLVDFGDMVFSHVVNDAAIAMAYSLLAQPAHDVVDPDVLAPALLVARGYHRANPLTDAEIATLFPLMCLRLALSVCVAAVQQQQRPEDDYLAISQAPIGETLPRLLQIDPRVAHHRIRAACSEPSTAALLADRRRLIGNNVRLSYAEPLHIVRGWMQYLFDETGRQYIDAYNNVPHVGHSHPRVTREIARQLATLNTNTRYLHEALLTFATELTARLPDPLRVCYFTTSGTEANELALRLARAHTRRRDLIVMDAAYHGHSTTMIDISPYKHGGPGGTGAPDWVHVSPIPDVYRGRYRADDSGAGAKYAREVGNVIDGIGARGLCGYIAETCPSVGGQIILPAGFLDQVYRDVRAAGGVCIADEVQTGFGRIGTHFWAFEQHGVVPDIVVLGKPIANGYPMGAVITTPEIAATFDNGMEFFSTFGGSTAACVAGLETLRATIDEGLQAHALEVGAHLLSRLRTLQGRHQLIGDVRGSGLFLGAELVLDKQTLAPATDEATTVVNRMRELGVLTGTDGPHHNVIKIRGPMPLAITDADAIVEALDAALATARERRDRGPARR